MLRYLAVLGVMLACFIENASAVTYQEFEDLINVVERQGCEIKKQTFEISELKDENKWLSSEMRRQNSVISRQEVVIHQLQAVLTHYGQYDPEAESQADLVQNTTIEERVTLLEVQVADLDDDVSDLEGDVSFLFEGQATQDERLLNLETSTNVLDEEVEDLQDATQALDFRVTELEENGGSDGNSSISELEERVETLEATADDHANRITAIEGNVEDLQVTALELDFRVTELEENGESGGNSSISELQERVETLEGTAADHETRIANTEGDVEGLEDSSGDQETRLTTAEENIEGLQMTDINHESRITALEENGGEETIAFYAALTSYDTIPINTVIQFNDVVLNQGNGYDSSTGVFTVPPGGDGTYYFSTFLLLDGDELAVFDMLLNDEGDIICTALGDHTDLLNNAPHTSCSAVVSLVEGDQVRVEPWSSTDDTPLIATTTDYYNGFNGFRI